MSRPRLAALTLTLAAAATFVALRATGSRSAPTSEPGHTLVRAAVTQVTPEVSRLTSSSTSTSNRGSYQLRYRAEQTLHLPADQGGTLAALLELRGRLVLDASAAECAMELSEVTVVDARLNGQRLVGTEAVAEAAVGQPVRARFDAAGAFSGLEVPAEVREAMQGVFQHLGATLQRAATEGDRQEATPIGTVTARYVRSEIGLLRHRGAYVQVRPTLSGLQAQATASGQTRFGTDGQGALLTVAHDEATRATADDGTVVMTDRLTLSLTREGDAAPVAGGAPGRAVAVGEVAPDADGERSLLVSAAGGMDAAELAQLLMAHGGAATLPDHATFLYRAAALLALDPEAARRLGPVYATLPAASGGRAVVLDLLAQVGTPAAQQTLVGILASEEARADPVYVLHVQRVAFVAEPGAEVVAFVEAFAATAPPALQAAASHALGAVAGHRARSGDAAAAVAMTQPLVDQLADPATRETALRGLGNAGLAAHANAIAALRADPEPRVRRAVASALRTHDTEATLALLLGLARDPDASVAAEAVRTLGDLTLDAAAFARLGTLASTVHEPLVLEDLVNVLATRADLAEARAVLAHLAVRTDLPSRLAARLRGLLG